MTQYHSRLCGVLFIHCALFGAISGCGDTNCHSNGNGDGGASCAPLTDPPSPVPEEASIILGHPTAVGNGLPDGTGYSARYVDMGELAPSTPVRMLIGYRLRDEDTLDKVLEDLYNPASSHFRHYLKRSAFLAAYGPKQRDTDYVESWLSKQGLTIAYTASNHLMIQVRGSAGQINKAFGMELHSYDSPSSPPDTYYGTKIPPQAPQAIADRISGLLVAMPVADDSSVMPDTGRPSKNPPMHGVSLSRIMDTYHVSVLVDFAGQGGKIGIVGGGGIRLSDVQSFWQAQGVSRKDPRVRQVLEPPTRYVEEATLDVQWAGGVAPKAEIILYQGPDPLDISVAYLFNEAIGAGEVDVVSTSFSHHESDRPPLLRTQHEYAAKMAAALGITVVAASGDSGDVDMPAACPHVTAVGGTKLSPGGETAWEDSGSGVSSSFVKPYYQAGLPALHGQSNRATADLALNVKDMVYFFGGKWAFDTGTSFATPAFAGMVAVLNSARAAAGLPRTGFLNPLLYTLPAVQLTFRDIVKGGPSDRQAAAGWDYPTGWGAPQIAELANQLP